MAENIAAQSLIFRYLAARDDMIAAHICPECLAEGSLIVDKIAGDYGAGFGYGDALMCEKCQQVLGIDPREIGLWKRGF